MPTDHSDITIQKSRLWAPLSVGIILSVLVVILWLFLDSERNQTLNSSIQNNAEAQSFRIITDFRAHVPALQRIVHRWAMRKGTPEAEFVDDAQSYTSHFPGLQALAWVDSSFHIRWITPLKENEASRGLNLALDNKRRSTLETARDKHAVIMTSTMDLVQGKTGFTIYLPIYVDDKFDGFVSATFKIAPWLDYIFMSQKYKANFIMSVSIDDQRVYEQQSASRKHYAKWEHTSLRKALGHDFLVSVIPTEKFFIENGTSLPEWSAAIIMLLGTLITSMVYLYQRSKLMTSIALATNSKLENEIRERKQTEKDNRTLFQAVEQSSVVVIITDTSGTIEYVNRKFVEITGYSAEEAIGKNPRMLSSGNTSQTDYRALWKTIAAGKEWRGELTNKRKDGTLYWESVSISPILGMDGTITNFLAISNNITARKQAEEALRESEERFRLAIDNVTVGSIVINEAGIITIFNLAAGEIFAYTADEIIGRNVSILMPEPDQSRHDSYLRRYLDTDQGNIIGIGREVTGLRKNGERFPMHLGVAEIMVGDKRSFIASITDLTDLKNLEVQLRRSNKMEAVIELTGGIAHDFNNLLGIIIGNLDLMTRKIEDGSHLWKQFEKVRTAALRGSAMTRRLLRFSSQFPESSSSADVNKIIGSLEDFIGKSLTARVSIEVSLAEDIWMVDIDPGDFEDALINLSLNARDAMPNGGRLIIKTRNTELDQAASSLKDGLEPGEYVEIAVGDTGVGMSREVIDKIFDPFFTTKEKGENTGLGLAMVYGFVQRSKGHISVSSDKDAGTTFILHLPRSKDKEQRENNPNIDDVTPSRGSETVLIVDDEEELAAIAKNALEKLGYTTIRAYNGKDALKILEDNDTIDLLFSDIVMPGSINGFSLAEAATKMHPKLKILLTSGFMGEVGDAQSSKKWERVLIMKPYRVSEFTRRVRETLDEGI